MTKSYLKQRFCEWLVSAIFVLVLVELIWLLTVPGAYFSLDWKLFFVDCSYCGVYAALCLYLYGVFMKWGFRKGLLPRYVLYYAFFVIAVFVLMAFLMAASYIHFFPMNRVGDVNGHGYGVCFAGCILAILYNTMFYDDIVHNQLEKISANKKELLKQTLGPHFVFNSLSTLTELIHQDANQAEEYLLLFSSIYRFVLKELDEHHTLVYDAVKHNKEYVELQQYRVNGEIRFEVDLPKSTYERTIFPLSLNIFVENAIKHNTPAAGETLTIYLTQEGDNLVVKNKIKRGFTAAESLGLGFDSVCQRYQIEGLPIPTTQIDGDWYIARMALLPSNLRKKRFHE